LSSLGPVSFSERILLHGVRGVGKEICTYFGPLVYQIPETQTVMLQTLCLKKDRFTKIKIKRDTLNIIEFLISNGSRQYADYSQSNVHIQKDVVAIKFTSGWVREENYGPLFFFTYISRMSTTDQDK